jgi:hypothetical protein
MKHKSHARIDVICFTLLMMLGILELYFHG